MCVLLIVFCSNMYTSVQVLLGLGTLAYTAAAVIFLLRYANRIHRLEKGAREASSGAYAFEINVGGGELGRIAGHINNITAGINAAVEQRMKSERLKTELITNVSHDIRTPLTSIITYADLLKNEGLDSEKAPEHLEVLVQKSMRLKTLTDELFEASKAATGNIDVHVAELDLVSLINQVLGELDGAIRSSGLDLRANLPDQLPAAADGKLMWRVMENLLSNVFKYSLPGSRVYLDARQEGGSVAVDLKNMSAAELNVDPSELTERFKRGEPSRTDGGSGLGLSIVQSFIEAQGGWFGISIDGDLFKATILLPCRIGSVFSCTR
jgi:signal transduction histidine kinase